MDKKWTVVYRHKGYNILVRDGATQKDEMGYMIDGCFGDLFPTVSAAVECIDSGSLQITDKKSFNEGFAVGMQAAAQDIHKAELTAGMYVAIKDGLLKEIAEWEYVYNDSSSPVKDESLKHLEDAKAALKWIENYRYSN